jgi:hypothetical protein
MNEKTDDKKQALGIIKELGELPTGAVISEQGLARIFDRHQVSVKRAVERGELPPSIRLFGEPVWTAGALLEHLYNRLEQAKAEAAKMQEKLNKLSI